MNKKILVGLVLAAALLAQSYAQVAPPGGLFILNPVDDLSASTSKSSITLYWTDRSTGEDRYEVEVLKKFKNTSAVVSRTAIPADSTSYNFGPVAPRSEYIFRVRPAHGTVYTAFSNVVTVRTK